MKHLLKGSVAALLIVVLSLAPVGGAQAIAVFDSANFSQNLLTAVRSLQQINNQVRSLQNEASMLVNMAKHLERMDYSSLTAINRALSQIHVLMVQADGIAFNVEEADRVFSRRYPKQYDDYLANDKLGADARQRWEYSMDAYRHTLRVQSYIAESVTEDQGLVAALISQSQSSVGMLQAQQATNELIALSAKQSAKTQQLMAAQYRAEALDAARRAATVEQARARFSRFIGDGEVYNPAAR